MDEYKVKITPQASAQMLEIFSYISGTLKEPVAAERLLDELQKSILSLSTMPKRVALVDEEPWRSYGVHITAVIYGRRDQLEQLKQMDI